MREIGSRSFLGNLWLNFSLVLHAQIDLFLVVCLYYFRLPFYRVDWEFKKRYFWRTPHMVSDDFLIKNGLSKSFIYGATPLSTLALIAKVCRLSPKETIFDLGCGPGRTTFFLHCLVGSRTIGVDIISEFIDNANTIVNKLDYEELFFIQGDFRTINYHDADAIYIYGSTFDNDLVADLLEKFRKELIVGAKVITITKSLADYCESSDFEVVEEFSARFPMGFCSVFLHIYKGEGQRVVTEK